MLRLAYILLLAGLTVAGCVPAPAAVLPTAAAPPTLISVTDGSGTVVATQPGPLWVLLSGVDEHGLIAEPELTLLAEPDPAARPGPRVQTGVAAAVFEIRGDGLRRFYRVQAVTGETGWLSDFYIRRVAYLFSAQGETISVYATPAGEEMVRVANVTPVTLLDPTGARWQVKTVDGGVTGWVEADHVVESSEPDFLRNTHGH